MNYNPAMENTFSSWDRFPLVTRQSDEFMKGLVQLWIKKFYI